MDFFAFFRRTRKDPWAHAEVWGPDIPAVYLAEDVVVTKIEDGRHVSV